MSKDAQDTDHSMSPPGTRTRLSLLMACVYAVQGAWLPLLAVHLQDLAIPGRARGWIFATLPIASLLTPLFAGYLADRKFAAQRLLATGYALGALILVVVTCGGIRSPLGLFCLLLAYWLVSAPIVALAATITLRNLNNPALEFGGVRVWGTIGWMSVGWIVSLVMLVRGTTGQGRGVPEAFAVAATLSIFAAFFALRLPNTPPLAVQGKGRARFAFHDAIAMCRQPTVGLLLLLAFAVSLTTPFVYQVVPAYLRRLGLDRGWVAPAMSLGQILEIGALFFLTRLIGYLGFRNVMAIGLSAWVLYHGALAAHPPLGVAVYALPIQGLAIACFHVTALMYLDTQARPEQRAAMQGLYVMMTAGLGSLLGSLFAGESVSRAGFAGSGVFIAPMLLNALLLGAFLLTFRAHSPRSVETVESTAPLVPTTDAEPLPRTRRKKRKAVLSGR